MKLRLVQGLVFGLLFAFVLTGCAPAAAPAITIENGWGRPSPSMPTAGGIFMLIKNTGDAPDNLLSGSSPACGSIELHEMVMKSDGTMGMNLMDKPIEIPAGGQVELKSGALHIMCIMKKDDQFKSGAIIDVTLVFEKSGKITVPVEVRAVPAITIENGWGRPSMDMPTAGGIFLVIKNGGDAADNLLSGSSPACGSIELHEMVKKSDGTMGMNLMDKPIEIPAGGQVELKSGGLHIMCIMKKDDVFIPGATIDLTLVFEKSGEIMVPVEVREK
jgi:copper(I)-binding protein